jgi:hypothetical protein
VVTEKKIDYTFHIRNTGRTTWRHPEHYLSTNANQRLGAERDREFLKDGQHIAEGKTWDYLITLTVLVYRLPAGITGVER